MTNEVTSTPGPYSLEAFPYCREPLEWMSPNNPIERIILPWGSQTGKTTMIENVIGQRIHEAPCPMLVMRPTVESAKEWSKVRFMQMVRDTPALRELVVDGKPTGNEAQSVILEKFFPGGSLSIVGANAPTPLSAKSILLLIMDERSRYAKSAGKEGDPGELAVKRATGYRGRRKIIETSTPTILHEDPTWADFLLTDQRYFHVPCPRCGRYQRLHWTHPETKSLCVAWTWGRPDTAVYRCPYCDGTWPNREKIEILREGRWVPTTPGRPGWVGAAISTLYAPVGWDDFTVLAGEWEAAHPNGATNFEKLVVFINTRLGEPWEERYDTAIDNAELARRIERIDRLPRHAVMLTAAVDVQGDRLELEVEAWGPGLENWGCVYKVFPGDPRDERGRVWDDMHNYLHGTEWRNVDGERLAIAACAIDTGYATTQVYDFCASHLGWGYYPVKGQAGLDRVIVDPKPHKSAAKFGGLPFVMIGTDEAKAEVYKMLRVRDPGPKYCHFLSTGGYDDEAFAQITIERQVKRLDKTGHARLVWVKPAGRRNELLDLRVYNLAMALIMSKRLDLTRPNLWKPIEVGTRDASTPTPAAPVIPESAARRIATESSAQDYGSAESDYKFNRRAIL